ncbi:hypothetical protein PR048_014403 [Dryococelus australis]|uniref:Uncharacterized protein n=1 Tax=Dryococelus australis TaxID=614101 RepID=A0ABQ9HED3_9NEOP|nr:hypothetical protein PR048_014403 [Dryococelus australis]
MKDMKYFHEMFYQKSEKKFQDNFIVKHTTMCNIKRRRATKGTYSEKDATAKYSVKNTAQYLVRVCRETSVNILGISARHVNTTLKKYYHTGNVDEKRGSFRKKTKYRDKKEHVMQFINILKSVESNYCRGKSNRKYLPSDDWAWHSYIPPDKVFGFIERNIKICEIIRTREDIYDFVSKHSTVKQVGKDTKVNLFVTKCSYNDIQHTEMTIRNKVTTEKKKDVENLLKKHYAGKWRGIEALKSFAHVIDGSENSASMETRCCQPQAE